MKKAKIYIDEFGNTHLDLSKKGTFSHFVYTAVIISEDQEEKARKIRKEICCKFRLGSNIKSKNLGDKKYFQKRLDILKYLIENLDFTIDVLIIDKSRIDNEKGGLKHKQVFYKYFQKLFVGKYNEIFDSYEIYPDKVGEGFVTELERFIMQNVIKPDLFNPDRSYKLADDVKDEKLVQLADIVAGSLGRIFCSSHSSQKMDEIYEILHTRLTIQHFPFQSNYQIKTTEEDEKLNLLIKKLSGEVLEQYIENANYKKDHLQIRLLDYLALQNRMSPHRLVPSYEIVDYLKNFTMQMSEERLRTIIRDLRYEGLFIISHSGKPGYKLASSYEDIIQHFNHFMRYIVPMLEKIKVLNQKMVNTSFNDVNPLEKDERFEQIKKLIGQL
ncbi:DUF3800 domain-containing protein [Arenibacter aquaticus]|uniref:DUF3800 domain-containing protein n=1 Tax=Arenibacter aquaticus TaxID=2489054 RepID=UPI001304A81E|nr:DUF3800 domain-containing protein [Arenibacter aquaticus]